MRSTQQQDIFMQWFPFKVTSGAASNTLVESEVTTGLSIRGDYAWIIHRVEMYFPYLSGLSADQRLTAALAVNNGLAAMPDIDEKGVICVLSLHNALTTSGKICVQQPLIWTSLPPTIIASPKISLYFQTQTDEASFQSKDVHCRIGYTTVPIDPKMYMEIAETFETL